MARPRNFNEAQALKSAMHVFWQKGYEATKVPDLLAATGLSRSSLYETFGDKRALFEAAIREYHRSISTERLSAMRRGRTAKESLTLFFDHLIEVSTGKSNPRGCFMINTATSLETLEQQIKDFVNEAMGSFHGLFLNLLKEAQDRGEIGEDKNLQELTHMLIAVVMGINVAARTAMEPNTLQAMADSTINTIFS